MSPLSRTRAYGLRRKPLTRATTSGMTEFHIFRSFYVINYFSFELEMFWEL